jgi:hypothetical protein
VQTKFPKKLIGTHDYAIGNAIGNAGDGSTDGQSLAWNAANGGPIWWGAHVLYIAAGRHSHGHERMQNPPSHLKAQMVTRRAIAQYGEQNSIAQHILG